jgi:hypothetical protein
MFDWILLSALFLVTLVALNYLLPAHDSRDEAN